MAVKKSVGLLLNTQISWARSEPGLTVRGEEDHLSLLELVGRFRRLVGAVLLAEAPVAVVGQLTHRLLRRKEPNWSNRFLLVPTGSDTATSDSF